MLTLDGLVLRQGEFTLRAEMNIPPGLTAVIGPSGGGKSTLLAGIAGFLAPEAGRVSWEGRDLTPLPPGDRPVSVLFQDNNLFPHLTVLQNVSLGLRPSLRLSTGDRARASDMLERVGLSGMAERKPGGLSGGQQSRAALARVLLADRPVVLLDEAFSALGPGLKAEMLDLLTTLVVGAGRTVIMVTHDPEDARDHAGQTILVEGGIAHPPRESAALFADPPAALSDYLGLSRG